MWLWMWIGLSLITKAYGFSDRVFPQSCESMSPDHAIFVAQTGPPPFEVTYTRDGEDQPLTVVLKKTGSIGFRGFLLEARNTNDLENGTPVGQFAVLDTANNQLMTCSDTAGSAVIQKNNRAKDLVQVQWTPPEGKPNSITFRATFVQDFTTFWEHVDSIPLIMTGTATTSVTTSDTSMTTEQMTATRTTEETVTPTAAPSVTTVTQRIAAGIMAGGSLWKAVQMKANNQAAITKNKQQYLVTKVVQILSCVLCTLAVIAALVLFVVSEPFNATLIGLVCVSLAASLIELVIICKVLLKPSHELKEIGHHTLNVISTINVIFTIAVIFVAVMVIEGCTIGESWLLEVMIVYTVLLSLFAIFIVVTAHRDNRRGDQRSRNRAVRKKKAIGGVAVFLLLGITAFVIAVIIGFANGDIFCGVE